MALTSLRRRNRLKPDPRKQCLAAEYGNRITDTTVYSNDSTQSTRTLAVEELPECTDIYMIDWPECSPDLNLIEHVEKALGRRIGEDRILCRTPENIHCIPYKAKKE
ncbi:hypothetical protein TNCV_1267141 [Trichonephila clavipes]|nr:hypothetical protein TNCV_1267141 [Trichonephila clavipes]